jgi:hypothetical protein
MMTEKSLQPLSQLLLPGIQEAVAKALDRHRRLGQSIAIMRDHQIIILKPEEIEALRDDRSTDIET